MLNFLRAKHSRILVWSLAILIVVGLAGFGISSSGALQTNTVAAVGDRTIATDDYARALDQELRTLSNQIGRALPMAEARQYGIGEMVLARLVNDAALNHEADRLVLSVGDVVVRDQIVEVPAFQGPDGKFSRDTYTFALQRSGLSSSHFEEQIRHEATREMIATSLQSAITQPPIAARTVLDYLGERRGFDWLALEPAMLTEPVPAPTAADLDSEYTAHPERYTKPETRHVTYVSVTPESLAPSIDVPEADLRAVYDQSGERFNTPEKRLLDRIGFATDADAAAARARLDAGEIDFDALAAERGLTADQIDQGSVAAAALAADAREEIFGAEGPGIVGPLPSTLGPSLYRINAILAASSVPFEEAREELRQERALTLAAQQISDETAGIEDLVAGGATLEEIANETDLALGTLELNSATLGGIADDAAFRDLANSTEPGDLTDLVQLASGGIATLRIDGIDAPTLLPLDEVRERVAAAWTADETDRRLLALAEGFAGELDEGLGMEALATRLGSSAQVAPPMTRGEILPGATPELIADIFAAESGDAVVVPDTGGVILARLTSVEPFDPDTEENAGILANAQAQFQAQAADDALALFTFALRNQAGVTVNQAEIDAVMTSFP